MMNFLNWETCLPCSLQRKFTLSKNTQTQGKQTQKIFFLRGYKLIFHYEAKIPCSPNELENEFKLAMPNDAMFKGFKNNK